MSRVHLGLSVEAGKALNWKTLLQQVDGERCALSVRSGARKLLNGSGHMTDIMVQTTLTRVAEVSLFN